MSTFLEKKLTIIPDNFKAHLIIGHLQKILSASVKS